MAWGGCRPAPFAFIAGTGCRAETHGGKQAAHMTRMMANAELPVNQSRHEGQGPRFRIHTGRSGSSTENGSKRFHLIGSK